MGKIELLWKFALQRDSAILMYLLLALTHTNRFAIRGNNKRGGNDNRGGIDKIPQMLFRVSSDWKSQELTFRPKNFSFHQR